MESPITSKDRKYHYVLFWCFSDPILLYEVQDLFTKRPTDNQLFDGTTFVW